MADLNTLLNNAEDEESLRKAEQEATIEHARMLVHSSLNESTWETFGITMDTPKTNTNPFDFEDRSDYSLEGNINFNGQNVPFTFEVKIGKKRIPENIFFYKTNERFNTNLEPVADLRGENAPLRTENERRIGKYLMIMKEGLQSS